MSAQQISEFSEILRHRYINHEISAEEYASLSEDIAIVSRKR